ncbi:MULTISPECIES: hypothetical protein [Pseudoalteromonas]|uniref:Uncharacterized protein n=2 Tax=Pseudoalteromonas TaxID=53246 RepID=A0A0F4QWP0_9GAMM|nr:MULTISPECIES: hypothetical protein [Pseudoalteromonas]KJZ12093.1 hypothetical protein TW77_03185 [Pseudoalteromonas rubra]MCF2908558.1 hypothetical protein [Pseudoalteromonas sp. DL2-H2.2]MCG7534652.1 hypothetical protein [Pseudoalteromonas sp. OOF1S-7]QTL35637.1 hypothetical protein J5X90_00835 [Pseudoalteromonas viridis]RZM73971.1 hypothetical protein C3B51_20315 [Pseudoalteromonas rubra]
MHQPGLLPVADIFTESINNNGCYGVVKYTSGEQSVYVKQVFINRLGSGVKPELSADDIEFFRYLDSILRYCYVLVYVRNASTGDYDSAIFLDDYEAIQGISKEEAQQRLVDLHTVVGYLKTAMQ